MIDGAVAQRALVGSGGLAGAASTRPHEGTMHPSWRAFVRFCRELKYGEIERLRIQDGLPVLAEVVTKKVRFTE